MKNSGQSNASSMKRWSESFVLTATEKCSQNIFRHICGRSIRSTVRMTRWILSSWGANWWHSIHSGLERRTRECWKQLSVKSRWKRDTSAWNVSIALSFESRWRITSWKIMRAKTRESERMRRFKCRHRLKTNWRSDSKSSTAARWMWKRTMNRHEKRSRLCWHARDYSLNILIKDFPLRILCENKSVQFATRKTLYGQKGFYFMKISDTMLKK